MMEKITRENYINGKINHREYYGGILRLADFEMSPGHELVQKALKSQDPHYNDIPLILWDNIAMSGQAWTNTALKKVGDFWSLAGGVCLYKEAVRQAVEKIKKDSEGK